ncbi:MAG: hypothetical protein ABIJ34_05940 [archaeon]
MRVADKLIINARLEEKGNSFRIIVIGESLTKGNEALWPELIEEILNGANLSCNFIVYNEAIPDANTSYLLSKLDDNLMRYRPDLVISMIGAILLKEEAF